MIRQELIQAFIKIVEEDYGKVITFEEAVEIMSTVVQYFDLLAKLHHESKGVDLVTNNKSNEVN